MNIVWSDRQQAVFNWVKTGRGAAVVEAVAGSGKTTTLVEAVRAMKGTVFLGAFNVKMAAELKKRVAGMQGVEAGTFHSAGFRVLRRGSERLEVVEKKVNLLAATLVHDTDYQGWEPAICALVSMAKQRGFYVRELISAPQPSDWNDILYRYDVMDKLPDDADARKLIDLAKRVLEASNADRKTIDFDDMIYLPLVRNLRPFQHDWVLIDEAQDTNPIRRALARRLLKSNGRLVAIGDPHQAIFGFTGADADSLDLIKQEFKAETLHLDVTYRCPKAVVRAARQYVSHIHPAPTAPEGDHLEMTLREANTFVVPGDAMLCRYNAPLVDQFFKLIRQGTPAKIEGRAEGEKLIALIGRWKVNSLMGLRERLEDYEEREVKKALAKDDEAKAERVQDQCATVRVLMDRGAEQGITTVSGLQEMVRTMFGDVGASKAVVVLSSVHRSKGLEWNRVFILGRKELMPSRRARQAWEKEQELNLLYVAITRAQETLVDVTMPE